MKVLVQEKNNLELVGDVIVHKMAENTETKEHNDMVKLVPEEGYVEESNKDGNRVFRCKQCDKSIKTEIGVKSHISKVHKNQPLKRTAAKEDEVEAEKRRAVVYGLTWFPL